MEENRFLFVGGRGYYKNFGTRLNALRLVPESRLLVVGGPFSPAEKAVISSMGLFSVTGLNEINPTFSLGSPLFDRITIRLSDKYYSGKRYTITSYESLKALPKDDEIYVQEYRLNGKKLTDPHIPFADVIKGGKLEIKMGSKPVDNY